MTEKQKRFCDEYLIDCNATRAYKAAYPHIRNDASACTLGGRLLGKVEIQTYLDELRDRLHSEKVAEAREVLEYLTAVLRGETEEEVVVTEGLGSGMTMARIIHKRPAERDRLKAAELLAKHLNLLVPKVQVEAAQSCGLIVLQEATDGEP